MVIRVEGSSNNHINFFESDNGVPHAPTNEFGIVIPPPNLGCVGEHCKFRGSNDACDLNKNHLHSTKPTYVEAGADDFRDDPMLKVWMHICRHEDWHASYNIEVMIPSREVMQTAINEARRVREMISMHREILSTNRVLSRAETTRRQRLGLQRHTERLIARRAEIISTIDDIVVLPEELVTGALLVAAKKKAKYRISTGSDYVPTGVMTKDEALIILGTDHLPLEKAA